MMFRLSWQARDLDFILHGVCYKRHNLVMFTGRINTLQMGTM